MALRTYRRKRRFARTPEPRGRPRPRRRRGGLAYVIQKHDATRLHFDFRLELDGVMKSWAIPKGPSLDPKVRRLAVHVEDHPIEYNRFEGVIPKGEYGGGPVIIWDRGTWTPEGDARAAYLRGSLKFRLDGEKLQGSWVLVRTKQRQGNKEQWLLIKHDDEAARPGAPVDIVDELPRSVVSDRTVEEIGPSFHRRSGRRGSASAAPPAADLPGARKASLPARLEPELATLVDEAPAGSDWLHEIKFDGYRALCRIDAGKARLFTRRGNDWTAAFAPIAAAATRLPVRSAWLDGEVVVLGKNGVSSFGELQNALGDERRARDLVYFVFDVPFLEGSDLRAVPLLLRKRALQSLLRDAGNGGPIRYSDHVEGRGPAFFARACRSGLEGTLAKRARSPYRGGRGADWVKIKCLQTREFAIVGYTDPRGSRHGFGSLVLGQAENGHIVHVGRVGTGFNDRLLRDLAPRLKSLAVAKPAIDPVPRGAAARGVHWVRPSLVADVAFTEKTRDGILRHPTFRGLRADKTPAETAGEAAGTELRPTRAATPRGQAVRRVPATRAVAPAGLPPGLTLTNPDKVLYPQDGITKRGLVEYYLAVRERIVPYIKDRPLTVYRCPDGLGKFCFWGKHLEPPLPRGLRPISLDDPQTEKTRGAYFYAASAEGLLALVQLGVLELHVWGSRAARVEHPDLMIFDVDPDVGLPWKRVVEGCLALRARLDELGLRSWLKTTGGKGMHVCVPLGRRQDWDEVKAFSRALSADIATREPAKYTVNLLKAQRRGRIFIDYLRNGRGATAVAAWSTRARPGAPVSMPLAWEELDLSLRPDAWTVKNAAGRLDLPDPWPGFAACRQTITAEMKSAVGLTGAPRRAR
ncbi:MAG TPA: DNA ligase D [Verrucomicrobiae bacterium]|nr:DNA ligase D [Verrucomicrobiae bacterium]